MSRPSLWQDLPTQIRTPTDIAKYRDAIRRLDEQNGATTTTVSSVKTTVDTSPVSIGLSMPADFDVGGSPITKSGTLAVTRKTQTANTLLAGPASGAAATPAYRALVDADIPGSIVRTSRAINTTAPLQGGGSLAADRTLSITQATSSIDGFLTSADWATFNAKVGTSRTISTTAPLTGGGDLSADRTIAIPKATASVDGFLSAADWASFNARIDQGFASIADSAGTVQFTATAEDTLRFAAGSGASLAFDAATKKVTISATAGTASSINSSYLRGYFVWNQPIAATTWTINHSLGKHPTGLVVILEDGTVGYPSWAISGIASNYLGYYQHQQATAATTWTIAHGMGDIPTGVRVRRDDGTWVVPGMTVAETSPYAVTLTFLEATAGDAYLSTGIAVHQLTLGFAEAKAGRAYLSADLEGPVYRQVQATPATSIVVNHDLGRIPTQILVIDPATGEALPAGVSGAGISISENFPYALTISLSPARAVNIYVA